MTFKRIISVIMAALMTMMLFGCTAKVPQSGSEDTQAPAVTDDPSAAADEGRAYLNATGEVKPIAVYASFEQEADYRYDERYTSGNNAFAVTMTRALESAYGKDWSGVCSPLSLQLALQILANGGDDETARLMTEVVSGGMSREDVNTSTAKLLKIFGSAKGVSVNNAVIISKDYRISEDFAETAGEYYNTAIGVLDFMDAKAAAAQINDWIAEHTEGLIDSLLSDDDITTETVMVLLNTLSLKLEWDKEFTAFRELKEFYGTEGTQSVSMIRRSDELAYGSFDEGEIAVIPYSGDEYRMAVLLPSEGYTPYEAVCALMGRWNECEAKQGTVMMPKVELDTELDVMQMLDALGIEKAVKGNYTGLLAGDVDTPVSKILQGAKLSVDEYGTLAAAATAVISYKGLPLPDEFTLECNRPYAMVIYNVETGAVLFVSIVNNVE